MDKIGRIQKRTVTIVDDNVILRVIFSNIIRSFPDFPVEINLFDNAIDALNYFENKKDFCDHASEIVFVDINMPLMTGWEMMEKMKSCSSQFLNQISIYMVSSSKSRTDFDQILEYPFIKGYLLKPIDKIALYKVLRNLN